MKKSHYKSDEVSDLEARMAENERRLAEINQRENKLKEQAAQFGMENVSFGRDKDDYQPYRRKRSPSPRKRSPSPRKRSRSYRSPSPVKRTFDDHSSPVNRITIKNDKYKQRSPSPPPTQKRRSPPPPRPSSPPKRSRRKTPERTRMRSDPEAAQLPEPKRRYERSKSPVEVSDEEMPVKTENFDHIEAAFNKLKAKKEAESKKMENKGKKSQKKNKKKEVPIPPKELLPPPSPRVEQQSSRMTKAESLTIQTSAYFNQEIKRAIADGRLKVQEDDILETGPNYSHTTNGRELEYQQRRIFIGHLPVDFLSKDEIYFMFHSYGTIIAISLHRGYCFVQYQTPEQAQAAANAENGRRVKQACLEVNIATISKEEARKLPRGGAALKPVLRATQNCRIFIENDHQRLYACYFERFLKTLGVTVDLTVWKETVRKKKDTLEFHLAQLQRDKDSICAICIHEDDPRRKTATVHIFKNELEEHRNMPAVDAICLIARQVEKLRKFDEPPPGRIGSIMRIIADGRMATLLEIEQVVEFLEGKREKLGGRKRIYQSDESTEKLKNSIAKLFGSGGPRPEQPPQSTRAPLPPPAPVRHEFEPLPDMPPPRQNLHHQQHHHQAPGYYNSHPPARSYNQPTFYQQQQQPLPIRP